jgi:hypothetical protein
VGTLVPAPKCAQIQTVFTGDRRTYMWDRSLSPSSVFPNLHPKSHGCQGERRFLVAGAVTGHGHHTWCWLTITGRGQGVAIMRAAGWPSQAWPARRRFGCSKLARARGYLHLRRQRTLADILRRSHASRSIFGLLPQAATTCPSNATVGHSSAPTACPSLLCRLAVNL